MQLEVVNLGVIKFVGDMYTEVCEEIFHSNKFEGEDIYRRPRNVFRTNHLLARDMVLILKRGDV